MTSTADLLIETRPLVTVKDLATAAEPVAYHLTDLGNAGRLVAEHGADLRFAPGVGWFTWDGQRWKPDAGGEVLRHAKRTVRSMYAAAEKIESRDERRGLVAWAQSSESEARLRAAVSLARSERQIEIDAASLDADPWLLNVPHSMSHSLGGRRRRLTRARTRPRRSPGRRVARRLPRRPRGVGTEARTVRASVAEWREWERLAAAAGLTRNTWLRRTINDAAALERTLEAMDAREGE